MNKPYEVAAAVGNDANENADDNFNGILCENVELPRRSRKSRNPALNKTINWGELLAKATEEDKKSAWTHPFSLADTISEDEEEDSENHEPTSPMNLSAPRHSVANFNNNALDLTAMSKSVDCLSSRKSFKTPNYDKTLTNNTRSPLKDNKSNTPYPTYEKSRVVNDEVVAKKSLFNSLDFSYERDVATKKEVKLQVQTNAPLRDSLVNIQSPYQSHSGYGQAVRLQQRIEPYNVGIQPACYKGNSGHLQSGGFYAVEPSHHQEPEHHKVFAIPEVPSRFKSATKDLVVNGKSYQVLAILGKGGSSKVYLALAKDNSLLAIKCVNLASVDEKSKLDYLNEIEHLMKMQHCRHIIRIIDHQHIPSRNLLYAVMERGDTDLSRLLKERTTSGDGIPPGMILFYWSEMLLAVKSIHDNNIIHRDLKPANFLLVQGRLKLIDFGIASSIQTDSTSVFKDSQSGTPNYMSPEAWEDLGMGDQQVVKIGRKTDVWSLGCILYTFLYGKTPFQEFANQLAKFRAITNPNHVIKFPHLPGIPKMLIDSCRRCLVYDKNKRASIEELIALSNQMLMTPSEVVGKLRPVLDAESLHKATKVLLQEEQMSKQN